MLSGPLSRPSSSQYVIGAFFSLAPLFDGLSLVALGYGARRILGLVGEGEVAGGPDAADGARETVRKAPGPDQEQSNN